MLSIALIVSGGCYDELRVSLREAHVYKGKPDPHDLDAATRNSMLEARFKAVQLDR